MKESFLSSNLEQLMRIHGNLSITTLAKLTKIPQPTLHHILSGSTQNPRKKSLEALASFFSITIEQLIGKEKLPHIVPEKIKNDLKIKTIPIIEWEIVKDWPIKNLNENSFKKILLENEEIEDAFALILLDSSMEPTFSKNALLIFNFTPEVTDRDFVLVYRKPNTLLFNRFFMDGDDYYIKQNLEGGDVKLIKLNKKTDKIIGKLIEVRVRY